MAMLIPYDLTHLNHVRLVPERTGAAISLMDSTFYGVIVRPKLGIFWLHAPFLDAMSENSRWSGGFICWGLVEQTVLLARHQR